MPSIDLLGLGCVAVDECYLVDEFPVEDTKVRVIAHRRSIGGTTGAALAAAARYGARCTYAARLDRRQAAWAVAELEGHGVDTAFICRADGLLPIRSQVIVSRKTGSRTVLYDLSQTAGAAEDWPGEEIIGSARLLLVDHYGMEGMLRAARIARQMGVQIVGDFESHQRPEFGELAAGVDHLIVSRELAAAVTGIQTPADACRALWSPHRQAVVVTCGIDGCWYLAAQDDAPTHLPAFRVPTIDTTGCGDVFHGVYAAALLSELPLRDRLRNATAAAAIVASRPFDDASGRFPNRDEVAAFLAAR